MASVPDELLARLLYDVALAGPLGLGTDELGKAVRAFYDSQSGDQQQGQPLENNDLLFSDRPPGSPPVVDEKVLDAVWEWLGKHPEVEIRDVEQASNPPPGSSHDAVEVACADGAPHGNATSLTVSHKHAGKRIFTAEHRVWHAIAGHGVDYKRISHLEFIALSVIAAAGPAGILQPELTRLTGQDKRSLPKRTDTLAEKGYITKEPVLGAGVRTSVLRLRKYAHGAVASHSYRGKQQADGSVSEMPVIFYDRWFNDIMRLLKANDNIATYEDVRRELGIHKKRYETKALFRCIRRLARAGCLDKLKARIDDGNGRESSTQWMRCIRLMREPTELDRLTFMKSDYWNRKLLGPRAPHREGGLARAQDATVPEDDDDVSDDEDSGDDLEPLEQRLPPQWTPHLPMMNQVFNIIDAAGREGIASVDLQKHIAAMFWRRPLDEMLTRLTDIWQVSQPPHLRHLAVLKDTAVYGKQVLFVYRSMANFEKAVEAGEANWKTVHGRMASTSKGKKQIMPPKTELDAWGFSKLKPSLFVGRDGRVNLQECRSALSLETIADDGPELVAVSPSKPAGTHKRARRSTHSTRPVDKRPNHSKAQATTPRQRRNPAIPRLYPKPRATTENDDAEYAARARATAERLVTAEMKLARKRNGDEAGLDEPIPEAAEMFCNDSPTNGATENPIPRRPSLFVSLPVTMDSHMPVARATKTPVHSKPSLMVSLPATATPGRLAVASRPAKKSRMDGNSTSPQGSASVTPVVKKRGRPNKAALAERERLQKDAQEAQQQVQAQATAIAEKILQARETRQSAAISLLTPPCAEISPAPPKQQLTSATSPVVHETDVAEATSRGPASPSVHDVQRTIVSELTIRTPERETSTRVCVRHKRKRDQEQPSALPEDRVSQLEFELLARSRPGAYINPPGAKDLKADTFRQLGRPRNSLIAVIKSDKLRNYTWFQPEGARIAPKASRARTSRIGRLGDSGGLLPAAKRKRGRSRQHDTEDAQTAEVVQTLGSEPLQAHIPPSEFLDDAQNVDAGVLQPDAGISLSLLRNSEDALADSAERDQTDPELPPHILDAAAKTVSIDDRTASQAERALTDAAQHEAEQASSDDATTFDAPPATIGTTVEFQADRGAWGNGMPKNPDANNLVVNASKEASSPEPEHGSREASATLPNYGLREASMPVFEGQTSEAAVLESRGAPNASTGFAITNCLDEETCSPEVDVAAEDRGNGDRVEIAIEAEKAGPPSTRTKKINGVGRSGGIVIHQRNRIVMDTVHSCGGVYPGDRELWYPFSSAWQRLHKQTPDRHTVDRVIKGLVASGKLRRLAFSFKDKKGFVQTRHVITEPSIDPTSPAVRQMQQRIIDKYPEQCLPEEADISDEFRERASNFPTGQIRKHLVYAAATSENPSSPSAPPRHYRDEFPEDKTVFVKRTPAAAKQLDIEAKKEGFTDAQDRRLQKQDLTRVQLHCRRRRQEIPSEDEGEEPSPEQLALQGEFQLETYQHNAGDVRVHSGIKGLKLSRHYRLKLPETESPAHQADKSKYAHSPISTIGDQQTYLPSQKAHSDLHPQWTVACDTAELTRASKAQSSRSRRKILAPDIKAAWNARSTCLLWNPKQTLHEMTGTFSTSSIVESAPKQRLQSAQQTSYPATPQSLPVSSSDLLTRAEKLGHPPANDSETAHDRFDRDIDRIEAWEKHLLKTKQAPTGSSELTFINLSVSEAEFEAAPIHPLLPKRQAVRRLQTLASAPSGRITRSSRTQTRPPIKGLWEQPVRDQSVGETRAESAREPSPDPSTKASSKQKRKYRSRVKKPALPEPPTVANGTSAKSPDLAAGNTSITPLAAQKKPSKRRDRTRHANFHEVERLVAAIAIAKTVCGGISGRPNWSVISHAMGFRYDSEFLRHRWTSLSEDLARTVEDMQLKLQEPFLSAYERGDLPHVDFENLHSTDWEALREWAEREVPPQNEHVVVDAPILPGSHELLKEHFTVSETVAGEELNRDEYFLAKTTDKRRNDLAHQYLYGTALPGSGHLHQSRANETMLLRSWARAVVMTSPDRYDVKQAAQKISSICTNAILAKVILEMSEETWFNQERKGKQLPGRNFRLHDSVYNYFKRWTCRDEEYKHLREVGKRRTQIVNHFAEKDKMELSLDTDDPAMLVLTNMVGQGHLKMVTILPGRNDDFEAPFPKLTAFGYSGSSHNAKTTDRSLFRFPIICEKTSSFTTNNSLNAGVPIPMQAAPVANEPSLRIPFWVDIHGNLIDYVWDMVLRSILHIMHFRPGATAQHMEQAHGDKLWAWEIELMLNWMEKTGVVEKCGAGKESHGVWKGGWKASEWWYCAFLPEIATWEEPLKQPGA